MITLQNLSFVTDKSNLNHTKTFKNNTLSNFNIKDKLILSKASFGSKQEPSVISPKAEEYLQELSEMYRTAPNKMSDKIICNYSPEITGAKEDYFKTKEEMKSDLKGISENTKKRLGTMFDLEFSQVIYKYNFFTSIDKEDKEHAKAFAEKQKFLQEERNKKVKEFCEEDPAFKKISDKVMNNVLEMVDGYKKGDMQKSKIYEARKNAQFKAIVEECGTFIKAPRVDFANPENIDDLDFDSRIANHPAYRPGDKKEVELYYQSKARYNKQIAVFSPETKKALAGLLDLESRFVRNFKKEKLTKNPNDKEKYIAENKQLLKEKREYRDSMIKDFPEYEDFANEHKDLILKALNKDTPSEERKKCWIMQHAILRAVQDNVKDLQQEHTLNIYEPISPYQPKKDNKIT